MTMDKTTATYLVAYLAAGVAVSAWTASRGQAGQFPRFTGHAGASPAVALAESVLLWPWAAASNLGVIK